MQQFAKSDTGNLALQAERFYSAATDSMKNGTELIAGDAKYRIENSAENTITLDKWKTLAVRKDTLRSAQNLKLVTTSKKKVKIEIFDEAKRGNRGSIAEGVIGAALAARFINKNQPINASHIQAVLSDLSGQGPIKNGVFDSPTQNPRITDKVKFSLRLPEPSIKALFDPRNRSSFTDIFESAVKYANGRTVSELAYMMYTNDAYDEIEVLADGLSRATLSKVDIRVLVNGIKTDVNVSLKAGNARQFGQVGGSEFEKQVELWSRLLKIDVKSLERQYTELSAQRKLFPAISLVYATVSKEINYQLTNEESKKRFLDNLGEGISYFATLHEEAVTLVEFSKQEAYVYNFSGLKDALSKLDSLKAEVIKSYLKPRLIIKDSSGKILIQVRIYVGRKKGERYIRNLIEKGSLLRDLIASKA